MPEKIRLSPAIEGFLAARRSEGIAANTIRNDRHVLDRLLRVCGNIYLASVVDGHITRYFADAVETRPRSLEIDHATLSKFFAWAVRARHIGRYSNPMEGRKAYKVMPKERRRVEVKDFDRLLEAAGSYHARDRMVIALGLFLFLRGGEIADLRIGDVSLDAGEVFVRVPKTRQIDRMPICEELDEELRSWFVYYSREQGNLQPDWYLVPAKSQYTPVAPIGPNNQLVAVGKAKLAPNRRIVKIESVAQRALESIGFPLRDAAGESTREGIHTLRRSGARARFDTLRSLGYDGALQVVRAMLHHSSAAQTEHYLGIDLERQHRNELTRGKPMFGSERRTVVQLPRAADA